MPDEDNVREIIPLRFLNPMGGDDVTKDLRPTSSTIDPTFMRPVEEVNLPEDTEQPEDTSLEVEEPPVPDAFLGDEEDDAFDEFSDT